MAQGITTADELLAMRDDGMRHELVRGRLRTVSPAGFEHGIVAMRVGERLASFVGEHDLGIVVCAETGFRLAKDPDTVRAPDAGFVASSRLKGEPIRGYFPGAPDLAVEVVSPSDSVHDVIEKVLEWLHHGCRLVWVLDPKIARATVFAAGAEARVLPADGDLDGGDVLPGFRLPLVDLF